MDKERMMRKLIITIVDDGMATSSAIQSSGMTPQEIIGYLRIAEHSILADVMNNSKMDKASFSMDNPFGKKDDDDDDKEDELE